MKRTKSLKNSNLNLGSHAILVFWSLIVIFPLYVMIINSFKDNNSMYKNPFGLPKEWVFSNYTEVLSSGNFMQYFLNSLIVVVTSLVIIIIIGSMVSYALSQWKGRFSHMLFLFLIAGMMLPIKIASVKLLGMMRAFGLMDTIWALVPIYVAMGTPIAVFILTEFIRRIPHELMEAASIDGAGRFKILGIIVVPMLRPAIATVTIYNLVPFWNDLWFPLILINSDKSKTLLLGVTQLFGQYQTNWPKVLAVLTLSSLPVILLYLIMSKQFIKSMTAGAVKG